MEYSGTVKLEDPAYISAMHHSSSKYMVLTQEIKDKDLLIFLHGAHLTDNFEVTFISKLGMEVILNMPIIMFKPRKL